MHKKWLINCSIWHLVSSCAPAVSSHRLACRTGFFYQANFTPRGTSTLLSACVIVLTLGARFAVSLQPPRKLHLPCFSSSHAWKSASSNSPPCWTHAPLPLRHNRDCRFPCVSMACPRSPRWAGCHGARVQLWNRNCAWWWLWSGVRKFMQFLHLCSSPFPSCSPSLRTYFSPLKSEQFIKTQICFFSGDLTSEMLCLHMLP